MTVRTNARIAGFAFLFYIAVAMTGMVLSRISMKGEGTAEKLANMARHATELRVAIVLVLLGCFCALVLAVTLYSITRNVDPDLALMILVGRSAEGVIGALDRMYGQIWLATASGSSAPDPAAAAALGALLVKLPDTMAVGASFFSVASAIFAYLLLRGRLVPAWLAWIGLVGSLITTVGLPLELAGVLPSLIAQAMWLPLLFFEIPLGVYLMVKGVRRREA
jgi:hypothetical protein